MFLKFYQSWADKFAQLQQQFSAFNFLDKTQLKQITKKLTSLKNHRDLFQRTFVGLDINTNYLVWVQIYHVQGQGALVKNYEIVNLKKNLHSATQTLNRITTTLQSNISLGIALPDTVVQTTTLILDANLSVFQLRQIFKEKSAALFNKPPQAIYFQYQVLGFAKNQPYQLQFLLVAVLKQTISDTLAFLKKSHLKPQLIDIESFARERGEIILNNRQLQLTTSTPNFFQDIEHLAVSVGLAMHPGFKKWQ
jgi:Tfp pilus assembly PilM family ATPase